MIPRANLRALFLLGLLALPVRQAVAHPRLLKSDPAADARVAAPHAVALTFNEKLSPALSRVTLQDAKGAPVPLEALKAASGDPKTLVAAIAGRLAPGAYVVKWQAAGDDGHPVRGQFGFEVIASVPGPDGSPNVLEAGISLPSLASISSVISAVFATRTASAQGESAGTDTEFSVESPVYVIVRAAQAFALIALIGVLTMHNLILPRAGLSATGGDPSAIERAQRAVVRWVTPLLVLLVVVTLGRLAAQYAALFGTNDVPSPTSVFSLLTASLWGWGWLMAFVAVCVGLVAARRLRSEHRDAWALLALVAVLLAASMAMSGHAAAASAFAMALQTLHVLGAGGWIGSLGVLILVAIPAVMATVEADRHAIIGAFVRAFSPAALACAGLVAVTGFAAAWRTIGLTSALWQSRYGQILLLKLALLSVAAVTGLYNWRSVVPALGTEPATRRLRRSAAVELGAAAFVIAVTAVLVATPTPAEAAPSAP